MRNALRQLRRWSGTPVPPLYGLRDERRPLSPRMFGPMDSPPELDHGRTEISGQPVHAFDHLYLPQHVIHGIERRGGRSRESHGLEQVAPGAWA